jgi:hypothetical protein
MNMTANSNNTNNVYFNDTEQFLNDPYQSFYPPPAPPQQQSSNMPSATNGFYDMPAQNTASNGNYYTQQNNFDTNYYPSQNTHQQAPFQSPQQPPPPPQSHNNQPFFSPSQPNYQMNQQQKMPQNAYYPADPVNKLFNDPVASMAVKYGSTLADQGKEYVSQNVDRWFSVSKLKYYFAVDTTYVAKKLLIILFPFINRVRICFFNSIYNLPGPHLFFMRFKVK